MFFVKPASSARGVGAHPDAGRSLGLRLKLHADELAPLGGAELAARLGAASADHLLCVTDAGIEALAASDVVATLLPGTAFFLGVDFAPARRLIDRGATVALATDCNPGTCPTENLPLVGAMACTRMGMTARRGRQRPHAQRRRRRRPGRPRRLPRRRQTGRPRRLFRPRLPPPLLPFRDQPCLASLQTRTPGPRRLEPVVPLARRRRGPTTSGSAITSNSGPEACRPLRPNRPVVIGFPQDAGVRRNHGRPGAAGAPSPSVAGCTVSLRGTRSRAPT